MLSLRFRAASCRSLKAGLILHRPLLSLFACSSRASVYDAQQSDNLLFETETVEFTIM